MGSFTRAAAPPTPLDLTKAGYKRASISSIESTDTDVDSHLEKTGTKSSSSTWNSSHKSKHVGTYSPTVNVYTTCGRHTDQFLFGGRSLSDLARAVLGRKGKDE